jgi:hypothetical protein
MNKLIQNKLLKGPFLDFRDSYCFEIVTKEYCILNMLENLLIKKLDSKK